MIQGGDPDGDGTGGPGYTIADEPPDGRIQGRFGRDGRDVRAAGTTGSQFFVT